MRRNRKVKARHSGTKQRHDPKIFALLSMLYRLDLFNFNDVYNTVWRCRRLMTIHDKIKHNNITTGY